MLAWLVSGERLFLACRWQLLAVSSRGLSSARTERALCLPLIRMPVLSALLPWPHFTRIPLLKGRISQHVSLGICALVYEAGGRGEESLSPSRAAFASDHLVYHQVKKTVFFSQGQIIKGYIPACGCSNEHM